MAISQSTRTAVTIVTGALLILALVLHLAEAPGRDIVLFVSSVLAGIPIAAKAISALRYRAFSIDLLVTIAVVGALIIGEYVESAVVSFLFLFGAWLEARTLERTRASLKGLIDLAPTRATVIRDGERVTVDADDVEEGEIVVITSGERIPVDGTVLKGSAEVSEAAITGEPVPASKKPGDHVHASTIAENGYLEIVAEAVGDETTFARIIELVEEAQDSRTRRQRFLERFAQIYTPAIIVMAILVFAVTRDVEFALVFLVIACPGALVISVPVASVAGLGNIARHGVLVKSGDALEALASADVLVVDKTGTLTAGRPLVTGIHPVEGTSEDALLATVAAVETTSEHHLARAIVNEARDRGLELAEPEDPQIVAGRGLKAVVEGRVVHVGSITMLAEAGIELTSVQRGKVHELESQGATVVLAADDELLGMVTVADQIRSETRDAVTAMRRDGVKRVIMLTGDNERAARIVADQAGVDEVRAGLLPHDKARIVTELKDAGARVAMIGDGVNDAPALAGSDVGIAMGGAGVDVSMETADVVLLTDRLDQFAHARRVARASVRIMKQNTALALGTVAILVAAVLLKMVGLAGGMLVHEISVLLVILNALRLVRLRGPRDQVASKTEPRREEVLVS